MGSFWSAGSAYRRPGETHSLVADTSARSASGRNAAGMSPLRTGDGFPNIVVTAVVSTTSLAPDAEQTWQSLLEGRSGIRELDTPFVEEFTSPVRIGGPLLETFDEHLSRVELRRLAYMQKMSLVLGRRLWETAGTPDIDTRRLMVSIGLALGSTEDIPVWYDIWRKKGLRAV